MWTNAQRGWDLQVSHHNPTRYWLALTAAQRQHVGNHPFLGVALLSNERLVRAVLLTPEQHVRIRLGSALPWCNFWKLQVRL